MHQKVIINNIPALVSLLELQQVLGDVHVRQNLPLFILRASQYIELLFFANKCVPYKRGNYLRKESTDKLREAAADSPLKSSTIRAKWGINSLIKFI